MGYYPSMRIFILTLGLCLPVLSQAFCKQFGMAKNFLRSKVESLVGSSRDNDRTYAFFWQSTLVKNYGFAPRISGLRVSVRSRDLEYYSDLRLSRIDGVAITNGSNFLLALDNGEVLNISKELKEMRQVNAVEEISDGYLRFYITEKPDLSLNNITSFDGLNLEEYETINVIKIALPKKNVTFNDINKNFGNAQNYWGIYEGHRSKELVLNNVSEDYGGKHIVGKYYEQHVLNLNRVEEGYTYHIQAWKKRDISHIKIPEGIYMPFPYER